MYGINPPKNSSTELGSERVPHSVFNFGGGAVLVRRAVHTNSLFPINIFAWGAVERDNNVFFSSRDEDTLMAVRLDDDLGAALGATLAFALAFASFAPSLALAAASAAAALASSSPAALAASSPSATGRAEAAHVSLCARAPL